MKTEQQYFNEAISIQQYMDNMTTLKEESFRIYDALKCQQMMALSSC